MSAKKHRAWLMIDPSRQEWSPIQLSVTAQHVDRLVAIAVTLGVEPNGTSAKSGKRAIIAEMVRRIADGRLVVAHPVTTEP